jgi:BirA family biotin operon repressor/biotin-[acetyl-CoA-carboxylase] ligase
MSSEEFRIIYFQETDSTNLQASALLSDFGKKEKFIVRAGYQRKGYGQSGNTWESQKGKNLLCSFVVYPDFLNIERHFYLSMIMSLAINDLLKPEFTGVKIKWPNDIYVNRKKIAGILFENSIQRGVIINSIAGVGLNVNQRTFTEFPAVATSMSIEKNKDYSVEEVLNDLTEKYNYWFQILTEEDYEYINTSYQQRLYKLHETALYKSQFKEFEARITGVGSDGRLILESEGKLLYFGFKEIEFM